MLQAVFAALLIAAAMGLVGQTRKSRLAWVSSAVWLVYAGYEWQMYRRVWCTGECNIRIDLLLFYPVLTVMSITAVVRALRQPPKRSKH